MHCIFLFSVYFFLTLKFLIKTWSSDEITDFSFHLVKPRPILQSNCKLMFRSASFQSTTDEFNLIFHLDYLFYSQYEKDLLLLQLQCDFNVPLQSFESFRASVHSLLLAGLVTSTTFCISHQKISYMFGMTWDCIINNYIFGVNLLFSALVFAYNWILSINQWNEVFSWLFWITGKMPVVHFLFLVRFCVCCFSAF